MSGGKTALVLLPGLGADLRLLAPQRRAFLDLIVPEWLEPKPRESLARYAERMARSLDLHVPFCLGGVSFGGMVALEMARWMSPRKVLLIASCRDPSGIPPIDRLLGRLVAPMPLALWKAAQDVMVPILVSALGPRSRSDRAFALSRLRDTAPGFLQWGARAIAEWDG